MNLFIKSPLFAFIIPSSLQNLFMNMIQGRLARKIFLPQKIQVNMVSDQCATMEQNVEMVFL